MKVSVIIPVYNVENYLKECLDSIVNQTLQDIEIICINDGSTDSSLEILYEYQKKDSRIQIITQENKGLSATRNVGLDLAKGEYIHFMDSDDMMELEAFEILYNYASKHQLDVLYFNGRSIFENEELYEKHKAYAGFYISKHEYKDILSGAELFAAKKLNRDYKVQSCLQFIRREYIKNNHLRYYEGIYHEDNLYTFTCIMQAQRAAHINNVFFIRRIRGNSIMTRERTYKHFYGYFICYLFMNSFVVSNNFAKQSEDLFIAMRNEINGVLAQARNIYKNLSDEEKAQTGSMSTIEKYFFQVLIEDNLIKDYLNDSVKEYKGKVTELNSKVKQTNEKLSYTNEKLAESNNKIKSLNKELKQAKNSILKLNNKTEKYQDKINSLKNSKNYKLGKVILWLPRKLSKIPKKIQESCRKISFNIKEQNCKRIWLIGTPEYGNLGDHHISESEHEFLKDYYPGYEIKEVTMNEYGKQKEELKRKIRKQDLLFFHGGGNLGTLWPKSEEIRRDAFRIWKTNHKIVFPQSVYFSNDKEGMKELDISKTAYQGKNNILVCRENQSYDFAYRNFDCKVILAPDMVFYNGKSQYAQTHREGVLLCFRNDKEKHIKDSDLTDIQHMIQKRFNKIEKTDTVTSSVTIDQRKQALDVFLRKIGGSQLVLTDRVHGMIFCAITGTPCVAFPNNYHKLAGTYEWIKELPYIHLAEDTKHLESVISEVLESKDRMYPYKEMQGKYKGFIDALPK